MYTPEDINDILKNRCENEILEFKEAKINFSDSDRSDYCAAIANEGGGKLLLGITNDRRIIGTNVYNGTINKIPQEIYQNIGIEVVVEEIEHPQGRVVIFDIESRPVGRRVQSKGKYKYPVRRGESLGEMGDDETRKILNEIRPDFSAGIVEQLSIDDIDQRALDNFRSQRIKKTGNKTFLNVTIE